MLLLSHNFNLDILFTQNRYQWLFDQQIDWYFYTKLVEYTSN